MIQTSVTPAPQTAPSTARSKLAANGSNCKSDRSNTNCRNCSAHGIVGSDAAGVEHDAALGTKRLGRNVFFPRCADNTRIAVGAANLAPHHTIFGVLDLRFRLVYVSDTLAKVKRCVFFGADTLNLDQRSCGIAVALTPLVSKDDAPCIQARGGLVLCCELHLLCLLRLDLRCHCCCDASLPSPSNRSWLGACSMSPFHVA